MDQIQELYAFGSCEIDQFEPRDIDNPLEKRPIEIKFFKENNIKIVQIICGSLHTLALTNLGQVYSWGCNDESALGRKTENEKLPGLVELEFPVDMIAAGDSHSIACNSIQGIVYFWGSYRSEIKGRFYGPIENPMRVGENEFKNKKIQKIISGENHAMVLCNKKVYVWGDPDTGCLGRKPLERRKFIQCLQVEALRYKNVVDIYSGNNHSFCKLENKGIFHYFGWGMNNWGQLGIGQRTEDSLNLGDELSFFKNKDVIDISGGSHHTIALVREHDSNKVYSFGKNDDGQLGLGEEEIKQAQNQEELIRNINQKYFSTPQLIDIKNVEKIQSGGNFSYAIDNKGQVYSWGMGDNYVLGNLGDLDSNEYKPFQIPEKFFRNQKPHFICLGSQHVIFTVQNQQFQMDQSIINDLIYKKNNLSRQSKITQRSIERSLEKEKKQKSVEKQTHSDKIVEEQLNMIQLNSQTKSNYKIGLNQNSIYEASDNTTPKFAITPTFSEQKNAKMREWDSTYDDQFLEIKKKI